MRVTGALVGQYLLPQDEPAPDADVKGRWYTLDRHFVIAGGDDSLPVPPITPTRRATGRD